MNRFSKCNCPAGVRAEGENHAPDCPSYTGMTFSMAAMLSVGRATGRQCHMEPLQAEQEHVPDEVFQAEFHKWWEDHGQLCRSGGGSYEQSFAFEAWRYLYPKTLPQAEPVAVMYADGSVLTKADCGAVFDICCLVETPLYAALPGPDVSGLVDTLEKGRQLWGRYLETGGGSPVAHQEFMASVRGFMDSCEQALSAHKGAQR